MSLPNLDARARVLKAWHVAAQVELNKTLGSIKAIAERTSDFEGQRQAARAAAEAHARHALASPKGSITRRDHEHEARCAQNKAISLDGIISKQRSDICDLEALAANQGPIMRTRCCAVEAAEEAARAAAICAAAAPLPEGRSAFEALVIDSGFDDRGLPVAGLRMLSFLREDLGALLALAATSKVQRALVDAHATETLAKVDYGSLAARCEWPREPDDHNGLYKPLHYLDSVLSYTEGADAVAARCAAQARTSFHYIAKGCVDNPERVREYWGRREVELPLALKALAAAHPETARALPLRWSLHLLGALVKTVATLREEGRKVPLELVVRELLGAAVPGSAEHQQNCIRGQKSFAPGPRAKLVCTCTCTARARESFAAALDEGVTIAAAYKVARHVLTHPTFLRADNTQDVNQREWLVRPEHLWLADGRCAIGRKLAGYIMPRATSRYQHKCVTQAVQQATPAPYQTYISAARCLPRVTKALGENGALHTNAAKRKLSGRTAAHDPPVSPKRAITAWFSPRTESGRTGGSGGAASSSDA